MLLRPYKLIAASALLLASSACSGHHAPAYDPEPYRRDSTTLSARAWELLNAGAAVDSVLLVQQQAVEAMRRGDRTDDPTYVLTQMGFYNYVANRLEDALRFYREAADSLALIPPQHRTDNAIHLYGDISLLYSRLGLHEEALEWNDSAIAQSRRMGRLNLSDLYRFRAGFMLEQDSIDAARRCYDLAQAAIDSSSTSGDKAMLHAIIDGERAYFLLECFGDKPDSVSRAITLLERELRVPRGTTTKAEDSFSLGLGYALRGDTARGLPLMERMAARIRESGDIDLENYCNLKLMELYRRTGRNADLAALWPRFQQLKDSLSDVERHEFIIGAHVRHELRNKEHANKLLRLRLRAQREHTLWIVTLSALIIICGSIALVLGRKRYRQLRLRREIERREADERMKELRRDLEAGRNSNNEILSCPQLIANHKQGAFRRAFAALYPGFIDRLKEQTPSLTQSDELFCMLICLGHTTDEIAIYLGISRASVNSARYRLRQKFGLAKSAGLDDFIRAAR